MKRLIFVILLCVFTANAYAQDTTGIPISKTGWKLYWLNLPLGALLYSPGDKASQKHDMSMVEAKPFIGVGPSLVFMKTKDFGFSLSCMFYSEAKSIYPIVGLGITLFNNKFAIVPSWNLGPNVVDVVIHEHVWQRRFMVLLSYNLLDLEK